MALLAQLGRTGRRTGTIDGNALSTQTEFSAMEADTRTHTQTRWIYLRVLP